MVRNQFKNGQVQRNSQRKKSYAPAIQERIAVEKMHGNYERDCRRILDGELDIQDKPKSEKGIRKLQDIDKLHSLKAPSLATLPMEKK